MTAKPHPNHQLLTRLVDLEEKVKKEVNFCLEKMKEYRLLCENGHLLTLVVNKESNISMDKQRIAELEEENNKLKQELETSQKMCKDLEEKFSNLKKECEEMKGQMVTGNVASESNVEPPLNVTSTNTTQNVQQLCTFSRNGDEAKVKSMIASGAEVNALDDTGKTPLHYAAHHGHVRVCNHLLDKGADVNVGEHTITPLHLACSKGDLFVAKLLIARGASVTITESAYKSTPLHYASEKGCIALCEYLLDKGADVNVENDLGATPLHIACSNGYLLLVKVLIGRGASHRLMDIYGRTPLALAQAQGHTSICEYLKK